MNKVYKVFYIQRTLVLGLAVSEKHKISNTHAINKKVHRVNRSKGLLCLMYRAKRLCFLDTIEHSTRKRDAQRQSILSTTSDHFHKLTRATSGADITINLNALHDVQSMCLTRLRGF